MTTHTASDTRHLIRAAFALYAATPPAQAVVAQSAPPRRAHHALAYDDVRQRVILTGGSTPLEGGNRFEFYNDLWEFDGNRWTALAPSGDKISGVALAYDTKRNRMLSFGGYRGQSVADLRSLDNNAWITIGARAGSAAAEPGFVYDASRDRFIHVVLHYHSHRLPAAQLENRTWYLNSITRWSRVTLLKHKTVCGLSAEKCEWPFLSE